MFSFLPNANAAQRKRNTTRQQEVAAAAANPTAPARASHIDRRRVVRVNRERRKQRVDDGEEGDDEEEEKEEEATVGSKRKRKLSSAAAGKQRAVRSRISAYDRLKEFPNHTLEVRCGVLTCAACNKPIDMKKKSTVRNHVSGVEHGKATKDYRRKKEAKQVFFFQAIED